MALVPFPGGAQPARDDDDRHIHLTDPEALEDAGAKMSFLDHLDELLKRLIACVYGLVAGCALAFFFVQRIQNFIWVPLYRELNAVNGAKFMFTQGFEPFMLTMKVGALAGLFISLPFIIWQLWLFIAPGLYSREKKMAIPFVVLSTLGFLGGALTNHYVMFPFMMKFFGSFNSAELMFLPSLDAVFSLYTKFLIAMGLIFQMPTIVMFLAKMRMVTARFLLRNIKYAVLITFIVSAVITPTADPGTQTLFAMPMIALYILSIGIAWLVGPKAESAEGD